MIYSLRGKLIETAENTVVVECAGVGYLCSTTRTTLNSLPQKGTEVMLYTYMNVREGAVDLFGFSTLSEKNCFCRLTSVSGVGPKVALAILSELKPDQLMLALVSQDVKSLTRAAGVGKKLAERILLELRDKVKNEELSEQLQQVSQVADSSLMAAAMWQKRFRRWWCWVTAKAKRREPSPVSRLRPACRS